MKSVHIAILALSIANVGCKDSWSPLDHEAHDVGRKYWEALLTKCGDSYFAVYTSTNEIVEFKGASGFGMPPNAEHREPSEADKLNGLEWKGTCPFLPYKPFRVYANGKWSDWQDEIRNRRFVFDNIPMRKFKGQWEINNGQPAPFKVLSCNEIPQRD